MTRQTTERPRGTMHPRAQVVALGPGEGMVLDGPEGITLKATAKQTAGAIGVFEGSTPAGFAAPPHIHHSNDELFYVLSGEFEFLIGTEVIRARPGSFLFVPRGTVHAPKVAGQTPGKVLMAFVPGGQEHAFEEFAALAQAAGDPARIDPEAMQAIARRYHSEFVDLSR